MMKRCGKCLKTDGTLLPVITTARGLMTDSWVHQGCLCLWQQISCVQPDPTRQPITRVKKKRLYRKPKIAPMPSYAVNAQAWMVAESSYYESGLSKLLT
jgi:hypothetical protein